MEMTTRTPCSLGFRMPAEWHPHSATQLHWPSNRETWPGERMQRAEEVFLDIIDVLHRHEPVILLADPAVIRTVEKRLKERDPDRARIQLLEQPVNDVWARDCGPIFVRHVRDGIEEYAVTDWIYNAWGEKYPPFDDDNRLPRFISDRFGLPRFEPGLVLEGGAIDTNGEGLLLTTESVLLNPNRNPGVPKEQIESRLREFLGVEKVIWLGQGLAGDDTDGHIDDLSRFLNASTVLTMIVEDPDDVNYPSLQENYNRLLQATDTEGNPLNVVTLPLPDTRIEGTTVDGSEHVPASYANFYIANGVVLVPLYDEKTDEQALELFRKVFPGRNIAGVPCSDLVWGQGSIHCITQQLYGFDFFNSYSF